jgi:hypothetical protein
VKTSSPPCSSSRLTCGVVVNGVAPRWPDGKDLACRFWVIENPWGSAPAGAGFDALGMNGCASTPELSIETVSCPAMVPEASRPQPCDPAGFARSENGPKGVLTRRLGKRSLMLAPSSPAVVGPAEETCARTAPRSRRSACSMSR